MDKSRLSSGCDNDTDANANANINININSSSSSSSNNSSNNSNNDNNVGSSNNNNSDTTEPDSAQLYMEYLQYKVVQNPELREKLLKRLLTKCIKIFLSYRDEEVRKYLM